MSPARSFTVCLHKRVEAGQSAERWRRDGHGDRCPRRTRIHETGHLTHGRGRPGSPGQRGHRPTACRPGRWPPAGPAGPPAAAQPGRPAPAHPGLLPAGRHRGHLAARGLPRRGQAAGDPGRRRLRMGLLVDGPPGTAPEQPLVHPGHRRPGRVAARVPRADAAGRRGDAAGDAAVRPERLLQPAVHPHARADGLRHVPGGPAVAARPARAARRRGVLRPVRRDGVARVVPAQPGRRRAVPAGRPGGRHPAAALAALAAGPLPGGRHRVQPAQRPGVGRAGGHPGGGDPAALAAGRAGMGRPGRCGPAPVAARWPGSRCAPGWPRSR